MVCCLVGLTSGSNVATECTPEQRHNLNIKSQKWRLIKGTKNVISHIEEKGRD